MSLHYQVEENRETIQYCDMPLYSYIWKYSKFPIGHPIIHVADTCENVDACLQMEGLIKYTVVPHKDLFHPVLPYRWNKKLLFCLCRSCVEEQNMRGQCQHFSDAEQAISGTWVLVEPRVALTKGYKVLEIHEVYEYAVTQYDTAFGEGGLFVEYINTFLKLKAAASGFPSWVRSPSYEHRYIEEFRQSEGITLNKNSICYNASKRGLAKLCLNSFWGKLCENPMRTQTQLISDPQDLHKFLATQSIEVGIPVIRRRYCVLDIVAACQRSTRSSSASYQ